MDVDEKKIWQQIQLQAQAIINEELLLKPWIEEVITDSLAESLAIILAHSISDGYIQQHDLIEIMTPILDSKKLLPYQREGTDVGVEKVPIAQALLLDLQCAYQVDSTCNRLIDALLFAKSYHALCSYRVMNWLWHHQQYTLAHYLQSRVSKVFAIDIHPQAVLGSYIFIGHGSGVVIGETAVLENNTVLMQQVTLGGTGKSSEDRHPKVRKSAMLGAGTQVLGNIEISEGAVVAPSSVVLKSVAKNQCVAGVPANQVEDDDRFRVVNKAHSR